LSELHAPVLWNFEYKDQQTLDEEQAIVAVPDVVIHEPDAEKRQLSCWRAMVCGMSVTDEQVANFVVENVMVW
jgi:hypothetical protein